MEGGFIIGRRARYNRGIRIFPRKKNRRDYAYYNSVNFVSKRNDYFINKRCFIASIDDTKHLIDFGLWMNIYIYIRAYVFRGLCTVSARERGRAAWSSVLWIVAAIRLKITTWLSFEASDKNLPEERKRERTASRVLNSINSRGQKLTKWPSNDNEEQHRPNEYRRTISFRSAK